MIQLIYSGVTGLCLAGASCSQVMRTSGRKEVILGDVCTGWVSQMGVRHFMLLGATTEQQILSHLPVQPGKSGCIIQELSPALRHRTRQTLKTESKLREWLQIVQTERFGVYLKCTHCVSCPLQVPALYSNKQLLYEA